MRGGAQVKRKAETRAATALVYGATLATCNVRHFVRFTDLRMEDWGA